MILFVNIFVATEFQFSQIWLKMPLDQTMNQSVEFLRDGIRYYQFHGYFNNLKYYLEEYIIGTRFNAISG